MINEAKVHIDETGQVVIEGDEQEIEVSQGTARLLAMRLCNLFDYRIKHESIKINLLGTANANSSKEKPIGK